MTPNTVDVTSAIRKAEVVTQRAKSGSTYDSLKITLSNGETVEVNSFINLDNGYLALLKALSGVRKPA